MEEKWGVCEMIVANETWEGIPLLHVHTEDMNEETPVVIFLHGFMSAKEHNLHYAYQLAKKGIRVLLPDALMHGDRHGNVTKKELNLRFWEIILQSIHEVEKLYTYLKQNHFLEGNKIGIGGSSMGAITACGCLKQYEWLTTAAICMGTPGYVDLGKYLLAQLATKGFKWPMTEEEIQRNLDLLVNYDITFTPEKFNLRPVFFWHGKKDKTVPFENTYQYFLTLRAYYDEKPDNLKFVADNQAGHTVTRDGILEATTWLADHLA